MNVVTENAKGKATHNDMALPQLIAESENKDVEIECQCLRDRAGSVGLLNEMAPFSFHCLSSAQDHIGLQGVTRSKTTECFQTLRSTNFPDRPHEVSSNHSSKIHKLNLRDDGKDTSKHNSINMKSPCDFNNVGDLWIQQSYTEITKKADDIFKNSAVPNSISISAALGYKNSQKGGDFRRNTFNTYHILSVSKDESHGFATESMGDSNCPYNPDAKLGEETLQENDIQIELKGVASSRGMSQHLACSCNGIKKPNQCQKHGPKYFLDANGKTYNVECHKCDQSYTDTNCSVCCSSLANKTHDYSQASGGKKHASVKELSSSPIVCNQRIAKQVSIDSCLAKSRICLNQINTRSRKTQSDSNLLHITGNVNNSYALNKPDTQHACVVHSGVGSDIIHSHTPLKAIPMSHGCTFNCIAGQLPSDASSLNNKGKYCSKEDYVKTSPEANAVPSVLNSCSFSNPNEAKPRTASPESFCSRPSTADSKKESSVFVNKIMVDGETNETRYDLNKLNRNAHSATEGDKSMSLSKSMIMRDGIIRYNEHALTEKQDKADSICSDHVSKNCAIPQTANDGNLLLAPVQNAEVLSSGEPSDNTARTKEAKSTEEYTREKLRYRSREDLLVLKENFQFQIQVVSAELVHLLQERHLSREQVDMRRIAVDQLLRTNACSTSLTLDKKNAFSPDNRNQSIGNSATLLQSEKTDLLLCGNTNALAMQESTSSSEKTFVLRDQKKYREPEFVKTPRTFRNSFHSVPSLQSITVPSAFPLISKSNSIYRKSLESSHKIEKFMSDYVISYGLQNGKTAKSKASRRLSLKDLPTFLEDNNFLNY